LPKSKSAELVVVRPAPEVEIESTPSGGVFGDLQEQFTNLMQDEADEMARNMSEVVAAVKGRNHYLRDVVLSKAQRQLENTKAWAKSQGLD